MAVRGMPARHTACHRLGTTHIAQSLTRLAVPVHKRPTSKAACTRTQAAERTGRVSGQGGVLPGALIRGPVKRAGPNVPGPQHPRAVRASAAAVDIDSSPVVSAKKKVVIIGGGWAGFGAAKHLTEQGYDVTLLDAQANPGGLSTGYRTKGGQAVEAGMKGFWYTYKNIFKLIQDLQLPEWPLTDWTTSGFWNPRGLVTEAPVFSKQPQLPTLLGQFVWTMPLHWSISLADRLTMIPFLAAFMDYNSSPAVYDKYDKMSAWELFRSAGVSQTAYNEFLRPTLLVGLFAPPETISAAVMLETLWYYAMQSQSAFDVCWCRGSIAEKIFTPLVDRIRSQGGQVLGGRMVTGLVTDRRGPGGSEEVVGVEALDTTTGSKTVFPADAVVMAVGINAMQKLVSANPCLGSRPDFRAIMNLKSLDVIAARLFFDRVVPTRYPANVLSGFEPTAGATFFNLNDLHDEFKDAPGSVIVSDVYGASELLPLSDEEVVQRLRQHLEACEPGFKSAQLVDSIVLRFPRAVTHFTPGCNQHRPYQTTSFPNLFMSGDWVKGLDHGANGLSQERAYVTGLTAANLVVSRLGQGRPADVLQLDPDEPHVAAARTAVRQLRSVPDSLGIPNPFMW